MFMDWLSRTADEMARRFVARLDTLAETCQSFVLWLTMGQWIREVRCAMGLTQQGLADSLEVDIRTVQRWEADQQVPRDRRLYQLKTLAKTITKWADC
jgi:DNA-binding transcriptional regulator YiaG